MKESKTFYRFVDYQSKNLGISDTTCPELTMRELVSDGVQIGGFQLVEANEAICELSKRKDNPLPMDANLEIITQ